MTLLWQHLDGELTPESAAQIADHLDSCVPCDRRAGEYRALKDALRRHASGVTPADVERLRALCRAIAIVDHQQG